MQKVFNFISHHPKISLALFTVFLVTAASNSTTTNIHTTSQSNQSAPAVLAQVATSTSATVKTCSGEKELNRTCTGCKVATLTYEAADCTSQTREVTDASCTVGCPVVASTTTHIVASSAAPKPPTYTCNCSKTCEQISSCEEAQYQLNVCGCSKRDGDHDGIACDGAPLHCQN